MHLLSQSEWARKSGFSRQYANELVKKGLIKLVDGKVDVEEADRIIEAVTDPGKIKRDIGDVESNDKSDLPEMLLRAKIKNEIERGKILEIKAKAESGELVDVAQVKKAAFDKARIVRDNLLNIPDRVASILVGVDDERKVHKILSDEIRIALEELASGGKKNI